MRTPICPTCDRPMQAGFLIDRLAGHQNDAAFWASGSFWSYILGREKVYPVTTWRCPRCGLLQSFAGPQESPAQMPPRRHRTQSAGQADVRPAEAAATG
jgi:hypothetical protein